MKRIEDVFNVQIVVSQEVEKGGGEILMYKQGRHIIYNPHTNYGKKPPRELGDYRIRNKKKKIMYVGKGILRDRCNAHKRKADKLKKGDTFEWKIADGRSSSKTINEHEKNKIKKHKPPRNKSRGGEGRIVF